MSLIFSSHQKSEFISKLRFISRKSSIDKFKFDGEVENSMKLG